MSTKKTKRTTKPTSKKPAKSKTKTKIRVTRTKKKPAKQAPPKVEMPAVAEAEITEPKKPTEVEPVETKEPITEVEREAQPPTEIHPEIKPTEIMPVIAEAEPEPEKAVIPTPAEPTVEVKPQPQKVETKKPIVEVKEEAPEAKPEAKPETKPEIKKRAQVKPLLRRLPKKKLPEPPKESMLLIIRLRGTFAVPDYVERTMRSLRLRNKFNATIARNNPSTVGMLRQVKDYVTWGNLKPTDIATLLRERGQIEGGKPVTDKFATDVFSKESIDSLAAALTTGEISLQSLWEKGVKPVFRLRPPSGGFKSTIKKSFTSNGQLGYRGSAIATLMTKMS
jgi:large subunit ribosomal protein L30